MTVLKARVHPLWWAAALVVVGACGDTAGEQATTTTALPQATTTTTAEGEGPAPERIEQEVWKYLGVVIESEAYVTSGGGAHLADFKVGRLGDGTYIGMAHRAGDIGQAVFRSTDLFDWEFVAVTHYLVDDGFHNSFLTLDDGSMRMYWMQPGEGIASATTADGVSWTPDPGWHLTSDTFERDVIVQGVSIVPRAEGGWRMYVTVIDCGILNLYGNPNCEVDPASDEGGCGCLFQHIYSAVSDDMLEWVLEPGLRHEGSWENGSFHQPHAWVGNDGRVRISSQMDITPRVPEEGGPSPIPFGTIISDDGLDFHTYFEISLPLADPYVVRTDDGRLVAFGSAGATEPGHGVRLFEMVTVAWKFDDPVAIELPGEGPEMAGGGNHPAFCFRIDVEGEGTFTFDLRSFGSQYVPGSAATDLYRLEQGGVDAPATLYIRTWEWRSLGDVGWDEFPQLAVATDENGVQWWLGLRPVSLQSGVTCGP